MNLRSRDLELQVNTCLTAYGVEEKKRDRETQDTRRTELAQCIRETKPHHSPDSDLLNVYANCLVSPRARSEWVHEHPEDELGLMLFEYLLSCGSQQPRKERPILLLGECGSGKTYAASVCAQNLGLSCMTVSIQSFQRRWYGDSGEALNVRLAFAQSQRPMVIILDEAMDLLRRRATSSELDAQLQNSLASWMNSPIFEESDSRGGLIVIATANMAVSDIDSCFQSRFHVLHWHAPDPAVMWQTKLTAGGFTFESRHVETIMKCWPITDVRKIEHCVMRAHERLNALKLLLGPGHERATSNLGVEDLCCFWQILEEEAETYDQSKKVSSRYFFASVCPSVWQIFRLRCVTYASCTCA
jgi:hypothetical protein